MYERLSRTWKRPKEKKIVMQTTETAQEMVGKLGNQGYKRRVARNM